MKPLSISSLLLEFQHKIEASRLYPPPSRGHPSVVVGHEVVKYVIVGNILEENALVKELVKASVKAFVKVPGKALETHTIVQIRRCSGMRATFGV